MFQDTFRHLYYFMMLMILFKGINNKTFVIIFFVYIFISAFQYVIIDTAAYDIKEKTLSAYNKKTRRVL